jgi:hypothetical protein
LEDAIMASMFMRRDGEAAGRSTRRLGVFVVAILLTVTGLPAAVLADPPPSAGAVEVSAAVRHDVSPPLRNLGPTAPSAANLRERPLRLVGPGSSPNQPDGAVQQASGTQVAVTKGLNFAGVGQGDYGFTDQYAPPDTNGAVGATQYVQWVNTYFAVFNKSTGAIAAGFPKAGNSIWSGFGGGCQANNDGDPIVQYDKAAKRWILTQFSVSTTPYLQCVAVSTTSDATGTYYRYAFNYGSTQFPDYPKLGVWPDAYYITFNMFTSIFIGPKVCAYDRAKMLAGLAATQQCFQLSSSYGSLLPGDLDGTTPPPLTSPNPVLSFGTNSLNLWRFHVDWTTSANTRLSGPVNLPVASFSRACNGSNCVPQPSTSQQLDSLGDRLMYRLAYRKLGDHESLVVNHSVSVGGVSSVRWYELQNATGFTIANATPVVFQQGTLDASDGVHRWMGSIAMDQAGDIALGYSASSGSVFPSIRYTGRTPKDAPNTMEAENIIQAGSGSQLQNLSRWGDYSAMTVDPVDDCTFWYTSEYLKKSGTFNWSTQIASFQFPGCGGAVTSDFSLSASPGTLSLLQGASGTSTISTAAIGTGGTVNLTAAVSPPSLGVTASLSPTSVSTGSSSTLTVNVDGAATTGSYTVTVTGAEGGATHAATVNLIVGSSSTGTLSAPQNLTARAGPGKGVSLSWSPPASDGGSPITGYKVYRGTSVDTSTMNLIASPGNVTTYKDTSTTKGSTYYYAVTAMTATVVEGPFSTPVGPVLATK